MGIVARDERHIDHSFGNLVVRVFNVRAFMAALPIRASTLLRGGAKSAKSLPPEFSPKSGTVSAMGAGANQATPEGEFRCLPRYTIFAEKNRDHRKAEAGFIIVHAVALIPMIIALFTLVAGAQYVFKHKLRAQSLCVKEALLLQRDLQKTLTELTRLNPQATRLRAQRAKADRAVLKAAMAANPYALAAAKAVQTAVIAAQLALKAQQIKLLAQARIQRLDHHRALAGEVDRLAAGRVQSKTFYWRPLAVEPKPPISLTPDYKMVAGFENSQQHQFSFDVILTPPFLLFEAKYFEFKQKTLCSVTLEAKEGAWRPQIVAASALSRLL